MQKLFLGALCLLCLGGCGSTSTTSNSAESYITEKPGELAPDRTAVRVAQQFAPDGVSNQVRLLLLFNALQQRDLAPSTNWDVKPAGGDTYKVTATLAAKDRPMTTFEWVVDFKKPPAAVCMPANAEADRLKAVHIQLDESNLKTFLDGPGAHATPAAPATPAKTP